MNSNKPIRPSDELSEFILYTAPGGEVKIDVRLQEETIWLTQQKIAALFGVTKSTVSEYLNNVFESEELEKKTAVHKFRIAIKYSDIQAFMGYTVSLNRIKLLKSLAYLCSYAYICPNRTHSASHKNSKWVFFFLRHSNKSNRSPLPLGDTHLGFILSVKPYLLTQSIMN